MDLREVLARYRQRLDGAAAVADNGQAAAPPKHQADLRPLVREVTTITDDLIRRESRENDPVKVVALSLRDRNIKVMESLDRVVNLRTLDLSFNGIAAIQGLTKLKRLKELKLYDNMITSIGGLGSATSLHTLVLSSNRIASLGAGLVHLAGLRVLNISYNQLTSLDGLGRNTSLEVLDASCNAIGDLSGLAGLAALRELRLDGNRLVSLKGLEKARALEELSVADNQLTSLAGLKACGGSLDTLIASHNALTSLDSLGSDTSGGGTGTGNSGSFTRLSELYVSHNALTSLGPLAGRVPALDTLDAGSNRLKGDLSVLTASLAPLAELSSVRLDGNDGLPDGYASALFAALPQLETVDDRDRDGGNAAAAAAAATTAAATTTGRHGGGAASAAPDVWVNDGADDGAEEGGAEAGLGSGGSADVLDGVAAAPPERSLLVDTGLTEEEVAEIEVRGAESRQTEVG